MEKDELLKMRRIIKLAFIRIGLRCDLIGFSYLCYAVELVILNPKLIHKLCKGLYDLVGKDFHGKANHVERSIRNAIENAYMTKSFCEINKMFNSFIYTVDDKPTPGELIKLVAEYYNLDLYKD